MPAVRPSTLDRREGIVVAAAACFAEQGYHAVGMREIAQAVGIKGASLYNHFGSKEEILHAIALRMTRDWDERHLPVLETEGTPDQRLAALVRAHVLSLAEHRVEHLVSLRELSALTPEHRAEVADYRRYYQRRVRDVIAAGARSGVLDVEDATRAAIAVLDMLNGIVWWLRDDHDVEVLAEAYVGFAVDGVLRRRAGAAPEGDSA
ncbi:TetR/AcrR family transcriptional regulator [Nocardioides sp. Arc9.136]|uniref:TetR/AcrR family transcriptional regulator n=1 Tax=Nocardioides sp. Arc9.136 TaxID=2996826 RepID=UPI002666C9C3|nr:TetR/AcrR family transcriptional regulator [Nocardioides sp. Arc9.136]WKN48649.1 TetR/AcrR family transcriptional regulator [Nocardioides sp. Arc9.136]